MRYDRQIFHFTISQLNTVFRGLNMAQKLIWRLAFHIGPVSNWKESVGSSIKTLKILGLLLVWEDL